jgi:WD40 repeat protein
VRPEPPVREFSLIGHGRQVEAMAFTADSKTLVSGEYAGQVLYWDMERRVSTVPMPAVSGGLLLSLAIDPQGRWLAVGQTSPDIRLFRVGEPLLVGLLKGHTDRVMQLAFLKDGRTLLSTGFDGSIRRWDVEKQTEGKPLRPPGRRLDCLAVWEDGRGGLRLAVAGPNFVAVDGVELERLSFQPLSIALSLDGTRLACPAREMGAALWDLPGPTRRGVLPEEKYPSGLAFTPDGKHVVVMGVDCTRICETAGGKLAARVDHPEKGSSLAVSPDGRWLAVGTIKGPIRVWHLPSLLAPRGG